MSNWWSTKLGTDQPKTTWATPAHVQKAVETVAAYVQPPAPLPPSRAPSDKGNSCPECHSGNYLAFSMGGIQSGRCYDCGYPIAQSSSGINTFVRPAGDIAETTYEATKQINTQSNYHPNQIVDRIA